MNTHTRTHRVSSVLLWNRKHSWLHKGPLHQSSYRMWQPLESRSLSVFSFVPSSSAHFSPFFFFFHLTLSSFHAPTCWHYHIKVILWEGTHAYSQQPQSMLPQSISETQICKLPRERKWRTTSPTTTYPPQQPPSLSPFLSPPACHSCHPYLSSINKKSYKTVLPPSCSKLTINRCVSEWVHIHTFSHSHCDLPPTLPDVFSLSHTHINTLLLLSALLIGIKAAHPHKADGWGQLCCYWAGQSWSLKWMGMGGCYW